MTKQAAHPPGASVSVDEYWSSLTDDKLRLVPWTISDPTKLATKPRVPEDLSDFVIELEYQLDPNLDEPVACAHCPRHQPHWHGFVLLASDGSRYLLGSRCGPKAYQSDYFVASRARSMAMKRAEALLALDALRHDIPDLVVALDEAARHPAMRAIRRMRGNWTNGAPRVLSFVASMRTEWQTGVRHLVAVHRYRDVDEETRRSLAFSAEVERLAELPNKQHRVAMAELRSRLGPVEVWRNDEKDFGTLRGLDWVLSSESPFRVLEDVTKRLRAYYALGAVTEGVSRAKLEQLVREAKKDIETAEAQLVCISSALVFFDDDQLRRLTRWAALAIPTAVGSISLKGQALCITDYGGDEVILQLPAGAPPADGGFESLLRR